MKLRALCGSQEVMNIAAVFLLSTASHRALNPERLHGTAPLLHFPVIGHMLPAHSCDQHTDRVLTEKVSKLLIYVSTMKAVHVLKADLWPFPLCV